MTGFSVSHSLFRKKEKKNYIRVWWEIEAVYALSFEYNKIHWERNIDPGLVSHLSFISLASAFLAGSLPSMLMSNGLMFNNYRSPQENSFTEEFYKGFKDFMTKDSALPLLLVLKGAL